VSAKDIHDSPKLSASGHKEGSWG